jgi:hypothetical protein
MPIMFSYELRGAHPEHHNHIQSAFERLGWEGVGGSCFRFPRIGTSPATPEDWLNCVVPALMLFRSYALKRGLAVEKFSLDAQSSTGCSGGATLKDGKSIHLEKDAAAQFGEKNLRQWLDDTAEAIPY